jgi:signal transduction histidine kinase
VAQGRQLGVLLVWAKSEQAFTRQDSRLMNLFADQVALALRNAYLHDRNRQLAIEKERDRLACELHTSVTQSLHSIGLAAQATLRSLDEAAGNKVREPIEYIHSLSQTALIEMREQLYHLHPTTFNKNEDLVKALSQHCRLLSMQHNVIVNFKADLNSSLSIDQRDGLYFIAKEALWNVIKHAGATQVKISLAIEDGQVVLTVEDNGIGFEPTAYMGEATMGLRSMVERAELVGGIFELQSKLQQGTRLLVRIPIKPDERA